MTVPSRESTAMQTYAYEYPTNPDKAYEIGFKFLGLDENVSAFLRMSDNAAILLQEGVHYSVSTSSGSNNIWGTFQFKSSPDLPTDANLVNHLCIYRKLSNDQSKRFDSQTIFSSTTEFALDKLTMLIQDYMAEEKYIRVPVDTNLTGVKLDLELPPLNEWTDGSVLGFRQDGDIYRLTVFSENAMDMGRALRQPTSETEDPSFELKLEDRKDKILGFDEYGSVQWHDSEDFAVQSDWNQEDELKVDFIKNKPVNATEFKDGFMPSEDKKKLDGIACGAEVNVQSDWNETSVSSDAYINNKPVLARVATSGNYYDLYNIISAGEGIAIYTTEPTGNPIVTVKPATSNERGGIKIGENISVIADGTISVVSASNERSGVVKVGVTLAIDNGVLNSKSFIFPEGWYTLPTADKRKNKIIAFDSSGVPTYPPIWDYDNYRNVRVGINESTSGLDIVLPSPEERRGKAICFNKDNGQKIEMVNPRYTAGMNIKIDNNNDVSCLIYYRVFNTTLTTNWVFENNIYVQTIQVEGILESDIPVIDIVQSNDIITAKSQLNEWSKVKRITTSNGAIKAYCYYEQPSMDLNIHMQVTRRNNG